MKKEELYELLGGINEKYVEEAKPHKGAVKRGRALRIVIAAAFAVLLMAFVIVPAITNGNDTPILPPNITDTPIVTGPSDTETDKTTTASDTDEKKPMGGDKYCSVHRSEYHFYPSYIIDKLTEEGKDFYKWIEETNKQLGTIEDDCPFSHRNIYKFVKHFGISKDTMIEYYNDCISPVYINIELLYSGTEEENDKYYRLSNLDNRVIEECEKWEEFSTLKHNIMQKSKAEGKSMNWSLVQLAYSAGITDLSKVLPVQNFTESDTEFIYNADALSALPEKDIEEIIEKYTPYYLDCLVCGVTPYDTPYERQVALNAQKEQQ